VCAVTVDDIASSVLTPEMRAALHDSWNFAKDRICIVASYLQIVGDQPQPESDYTLLNLIYISKIIEAYGVVLSYWHSCIVILQLL